MYQEVTSDDVSALNFTSLQLYDQLVNPPPPAPGFSSNLVDVRDVALGHVLSLEKEIAGGQRFITSAGSFSFEEFREFVHQT